MTYMNIFDQSKLIVTYILAFFRLIIRLFSLCKKMIQFPQIDGHVWYENADGTIYDPYFQEYSYVAKLRNTTTKRAYKEAPAIVQQVILSKYFQTFFDVNNLEDADETYIHAMMCAYPTPRFNCCVQNVIVHHCKLDDKQRGRIVFGSMGFKRADGSVFWEFGGEDWQTVQQFMKKPLRINN